MPKPDVFGNFVQATPRDPFPGGGRVAVLIDEHDCDNRVRAEIVELQAGEGFPLHIHPKSDHIILVVGGRGTLQWGGEYRPIITGDTFVVPMGDVHSISADAVEGLRFVVMNVPPIPFHDHDFMKEVKVVRNA